jgi:hypothetical protein
VKRPLDATGDRDNLILAPPPVVLAVVAVGGVWVCEHLAAVWSGTARPSRDPLRLFVAVVSGRQPWPAAASWVAGGLVLALLVLVVVVIVVWPKGERHPPQVRPQKRAHVW